MPASDPNRPSILVVKDDIESDAALTEIPASKNKGFLVAEDEARVLQFRRRVAFVQAKNCSAGLSLRDRTVHEGRQNKSGRMRVEVPMAKSALRIGKKARPNNRRETNAPTTQSGAIEARSLSNSRLLLLPGFLEGGTGE
jgi:hypothetical protein